MAAILDNPSYTYMILPSTPVNHKYPVLTVWQCRMFDDIHIGLLTNFLHQCRQTNTSSLIDLYLLGDIPTCHQQVCANQQILSFKNTQPVQSYTST